MSGVRRERLAFVLLTLLALSLTWLGLRGLDRGQGAVAPVAERAASAEPRARHAADVPLLSPGTAPSEIPIRADRPADRVPHHAQPPPAAPARDGTLRVLVQSRETGAPLAGVPIRVLSRGDPAWIRIPAELPSRGGVGDVLATDETGRVEVRMPTGRAFSLQANWDGTVAAGGAVAEVAAFERGEERELVLSIRTELDLVWHGRVVDGATGEPLAGARVERLDRDPRSAIRLDGRAELSATDGLVRLGFASWRESYARVTLDGYAPAGAVLLPGFEDPASAFAVRMLRPAALTVRVEDHTGAPIRRVEVEVSCSAVELLQGNAPRGGLAPRTWTARTDAEGRARFVALPPRAALVLALREAAHEPLREERPLHLEPGEERQIVWTLGVGCTIQGRTLEPDGRPAPGVLLWLLASDGYTVLSEYRRHEVLQSARSDPQGRFSFEDVPAGEWLVGPAPEEPQPHPIAASAVRVVVSPEQETATVNVPCWRGLYLSGSAVASGELDTSDVFVRATSRDFDAVDEVDEAGAFVLGPLVPGTYAVAAGTESGVHADSEIAWVQAGTHGLRLELRPGAKLRVRVRDEHGRPRANLLTWAVNEHDEASSRRASTDEHGDAEIPGLLPGVYTVTVADSSGFGISGGIRLEAGEDRSLDVALERACLLRLSTSPMDDRTLGIAIRRSGLVISYESADARTCPVPPGELQVDLVRWRPDGGEVLQTRHVTARLGEECVVDFDAPR